MLYHGSRPPVNVKKLYCEEKWAKWVKKPAAGETFFTISWQFSTFYDSFKLVQRTFLGGSITFLQITLVPN